MSTEGSSLRVRQVQLSKQGESRNFFNVYSEVEALVRFSKKPGEAVELFHRSKDDLQSRISSGTREASADEHSILSLIYWLYPIYIGHNRGKHARKMFRHAAEAIRLSRKPNSEPLSIGLLIQLRILPYLIRSKKVEEDVLRRVRERATAILEKYADEKIELDQAQVALIYEGLGFSYYQLEGDEMIASAFLTKAIENFRTVYDCLSRRLNSNSFELRSKWMFYTSFFAIALFDLGCCYESMSENSEGEEMFSLMELAESKYVQGYHLAEKTPWHVYKGLIAYNLSTIYFRESERQFERQKAKNLLVKAVRTADESLRWLTLWSVYEGDFLGGSWPASIYQELARYSKGRERNRLMAHSLSLVRKAEKIVNDRRLKQLHYQLVNIGDIYYHNAEYYRQIAFRFQSSSRISDTKRGESYLRKGLENCLKSKQYYDVERHSNRAVDSLLLGSDICYELMGTRAENVKTVQSYSRMARRFCLNTIKLCQKHGWNERVAESNWRLAQIYDRAGDFEEAAEKYLSAHKTYDLANKLETATNMYKELSIFMFAWSRVELAKLTHRSSDFGRASSFYWEASETVTKTKRWQNLSYLYAAESMIEIAEEKSLAEETRASITAFNDAVGDLQKYLDAPNEDDPDNARSAHRFANLLMTFCRARILLERSKEAFKMGDVGQSIHHLSGAESTFAELAEKPLISDSLRSNELKSLASLCSAMRRFQQAQIIDDPKLYLEAKEIFEKASEESRSRSLKPLLSGFANFSEFLYYSKKVENSLERSLDIESLINCNKSLETAETMFRKLGNRTFLSMLKASKHILDATMKMNAAEREMGDTSIRSALYAQAQRSLTFASKYYMTLGSSKRVKESLDMIVAVKHHKNLIPLARDIMAEVASNQIIYSAIASSSIFEQSSENSARVLESAYVVLYLKMPDSYALTGEPFSFELHFSNLGRESAICVRVDEVLPEGFELVSSSHEFSKERSLTMNMRLEPKTSKLVTITAKSNTQGEFFWHPSLIYLDSERNYKATRAQTAKVVVESNKGNDFAHLVDEKLKLESTLKQLQAKQTEDPTAMDEIYSIKEKISKIEEEFTRTKSEYDKMVSELEDVHSELISFDSTGNNSLEADSKASLEAEEKLLKERIERRRLLLEQIQLK